jgi:hypothetical protein
MSTFYVNAQNASSLLCPAASGRGKMTELEEAGIETLGAVSGQVNRLASRPGSFTPQRHVRDLNPRNLVDRAMGISALPRGDL